MNTSSTVYLTSFNSSVTGISPFSLTIDPINVEDILENKKIYKIQYDFGDGYVTNQLVNFNIDDKPSLHPKQHTFYIKNLRNTSFPVNVSVYQINKPNPTIFSLSLNLRVPDLENVYNINQTNMFDEVHLINSRMFGPTNNILYVFQSKNPNYMLPVIVNWKSLEPEYNEVYEVVKDLLPKQRAFTVLSPFENEIVTSVETGSEIITQNPVMYIENPDYGVYKDNPHGSYVPTPVPWTPLGQTSTGEYVHNPVTWQQMGQSIEGEIFIGSGYSVSINAAGNRIATSSLLDDNLDRGITRIYELLDDGSWLQLGDSITGKNENDKSGDSIALNRDGDIIAISSTKNNDNGSNTGHTRIFQWNGTSWNQLGQDIGGKVLGEYSGYAVSLNGSGDIVAISSPFTAVNRGKTLIYKFNGTIWEQLGLDIFGESKYDQSGYSISLNSEGNILAIGGILNDGNGMNSGHTRIYKWDGYMWNKMGSDIDGDSTEDQSGYSVSLNYDGTRVAIGSILNDENGNNTGNVKAYEWQSTDWIQLGQTITGDVVGEQLGGSVSLNDGGDIVAISSLSNNGGGCTKIYELAVSSPRGTGIPEWKKIDQIEVNKTGYTSKNSVAINSTGNTVVIGSRLEDINSNESGETKVYSVDLSLVRTIFYTPHSNPTPTVSPVIPKPILQNPPVPLPNVWIQIGKDPHFKDQDLYGDAGSENNGWSVAMNNTGDIIAVGAPHYDGNAGRVRVYQYNGISWIHLGQDIKGLGFGYGDQSGWSIYMNSNGNRIAIASPYNSGSGGFSSGCVRVYEYQNNIWNKLGEDINGNEASDNSGWSVSMNSSGNIVAIGSPYNDENGTDSGHVRIYQYDGTSWVQLGQDIEGEAPMDSSGWSISINGDGDRLVIGAPYNDGIIPNSGHARVYEYDGTSWVQLGQDIDGEYRGDTATSSDQTGYSVKINKDGDLIAIGSLYNYSNGNVGQVRVYQYNGESWVQLGQDINTEANEDGRGWSISMNEYGNVIALGSPYSDGNGNLSGSVRMYQYNGTYWVKLGHGIDGKTSNERSGWSISMNSVGDRIIIGAPYNDNINGEDSGCARVYKLTGFTSPPMIPPPQ